MEIFESNDDYAKYYKLVSHVRGLANGTRRTRPDLVVFIGRPGVGKTTRIMSSVQDSETHFQSDGQWWNGYTGQKNIVLDDFRGWIPLHVFLKLIDIVPLKLQIKGGFTPNVAPEKVWISTNFMPCDWWKDITGNQLQAITRRISKLVIWDEDGEMQEYSSWEEYLAEGTYHGYKAFLARDEMLLEPVMDPVL